MSWFLMLEENSHNILLLQHCLYLLNQANADCFQNKQQNWDYRLHYNC
jgi:hypothetical protein